MKAKTNMKRALMRLNRSLYRNGPEILSKLCIGGVIVTVGLAIQATAEAIRKIDRKKEELETELTPMEVAKVAAPCYVPTAISCALTIACAASSNSAHSRRSAAFATAYSLSESALRDYQRKVAETVGEEKAEEIKKAVNKDIMDSHPCPNEMERLVLEGTGPFLCYETTVGRYFYSDKNSIRDAAEELNHQMNSMPESYSSLNEFYMELGLKCTDIGDSIGWNVNRGLIKPEFSSCLTRTGVPCIMVSYEYPPDYNFDRC